MRFEVIASDARQIVAAIGDLVGELEAIMDAPDVTPLALSPRFARTVSTALNRLVRVGTESIDPVRPLMIRMERCLASLESEPTSDASTGLILDASTTPSFRYMQARELVEALRANVEYAVWLAQLSLEPQVKVEEVIKYRTRRTGELRPTGPKDRPSICISFRDDATVSTLGESREWSRKWWIILHGFSFKDGGGIDDIQIVDLRRGSIEATIAIGLGTFYVLSVVAKHVLDGLERGARILKHVQEIRKLGIESRKMKLETRKIEQEIEHFKPDRLERACKELKAEGADVAAVMTSGGLLWEFVQKGGGLKLISCPTRTNLRRFAISSADARMLQDGATHFRELEKQFAKLEKLRPALSAERTGRGVIEHDATRGGKSTAAKKKAPAKGRAKKTGAKKKPAKTVAKPGAVRRKTRLS